MLPLFFMATHLLATYLPDAAVADIRMLGLSHIIDAAHTICLASETLGHVALDVTNTIEVGGKVRNYDIISFDIAYSFGLEYSTLLGLSCENYVAYTLIHNLQDIALEIIEGDIAHSFVGHRHHLRLENTLQVDIAHPIIVYHIYSGGYDANGDTIVLLHLILFGSLDGQHTIAIYFRLYEENKVFGATRLYQVLIALFNGDVGHYIAVDCVKFGQLHTYHYSPAPLGHGIGGICGIPYGRSAQRHCRCKHTTTQTGCHQYFFHILFALAVLFSMH